MLILSRIILTLFLGWLIYLVWVNNVDLVSWMHTKSKALLPIAENEKSSNTGSTGVHAGNQAPSPNKTMSEQHGVVSGNHPSMQILGEKTSVDSAKRHSEIAFQYNAMLENSGVVPIRFEGLYVKFGAEGFNSWTLSLQNSFYLKPNEIYPIEYILPWWRIDEIMKGRTNTTYRIHIIARFQDERGKTVERSRWIGSFENSSPSPVINGGNIFN